MALTTDQQTAYEKLMGVFRRTKPDGSYYYSSEDVEHWIPIMLITLGDPPETWTPRNREIFSAFLDKVGIAEEKDGQRAFAKVLAYYRKHPVNPELEQELAAVGTNLRLDGNELQRQKAAAYIAQVAGKARDSGKGLAAPTSGVQMRKARPKKKT